MEYYYKNKQKIKLRTHIYFKNYYIKNHMKMLDRQRQHRHKNYDRIPNTNQQYTKNVKIVLALIYGYTSQGSFCPYT